MWVLKRQMNGELKIFVELPYLKWQPNVHGFQHRIEFDKDFVSVKSDHQKNSFTFCLGGSKSLNKVLWNRFCKQ